MRTTLTTLLLTTIPFLMAQVPALGAEPAPHPALDAAVLQVREAAWRAWFAGDEAKLRELLPADFLAINMGGTEMVDLETTIRQSKAFAAGGSRLVALEFPETRAQHYGDVMVFYGRFKAVIGSAGGEPKEQVLEGRLTEMFLFQNGRWVHTGWHLDTVAAP